MDLRNRRGAGEVALVLTLTTLLLAACGYYLLKIYFDNTGVVPGVFFLGHDLGYLRQDKALGRIEEVVRSTYNPPVYLRYGDRIWILRYGEHFKLTYDAGKILLDAIDVGRHRSVLERIGHVIHLDYPRVDLAWQPHVDHDFSMPNIAKALKKVSQAKIFAKPALEPGRVELTILSGDMAVQQVIDALEASIHDEPLTEYRVIHLEHLEKGGTVKTVPIDDPEQGFTKVLAEQSTKYDVNDRPRVANIDATLQKLQGVIVNPGDCFSFNDVVGPRTEATGFQPVPVVLKDSVTTDIEAGTGQVATTLYKPVLMTGAKVVERHISDYYTPAIDYCQPGLEAAVSTTSADFKFQNTLDFPIMFDGLADAGTLQVRLLGLQELPYTIDVRLGRQQKVSYETRIVKDATLLRGIEVIDQVGIDGYSVKVFRTFLAQDGTKLREELLNEKPDEYLARTSVVRIGTASSSAAIPSMLQPAGPRSLPLTPSSTDVDDDGGFLGLSPYDDEY